LVEYTNSLDAKILFGRRNEQVIPPSAYNLKQFNLQSAPLITSINPKSDLIAEYQKVVTYLNEHLKITKLPDEETIQMIEGMEGSIWYVIADNTVQLKCKPDIIRDIHMAGAERIPTHSIYTTVINSFEENDNPTLEDIKKLLTEEFSESMVEKKIPTIEKILAEVRFTNILRAEVLDEYQKHPEFDIIKNRGMVMRHFASKYDKNVCGKIFKLLFDEFGVK
jgi:translation elongation factor EF-G